MNKKILQKISTELEKKKPNLAYIRGMVESLIEMDTSTAYTTAPRVNDAVATTPPREPAGIIPKPDGTGPVDPYSTESDLRKALQKK